MATITLTYTVTAQDQARILAAYQSDADSDLGSTANAAQVLAYLRKIFQQEVMGRVRSYESSAAQAALPAINNVIMS